MRALKLGWTESQIKKASVTTQAHEGIETYAQRVALTDVYKRQPLNIVLEQEASQ